MATLSDLTSLRQWNAVHIDETIEHLTGYHENELFYNCTIKNMAGAVLKDCVLRRSKLPANGIAALKDITVTLNCHSFDELEMSEDAFDFFLLLMLRTKGNAEKRKKLIDVVGKERVQRLLFADFPGAS